MLSFCSNIYIYNKKDLYCDFVLENLKILDERKKSSTHSHIFKLQVKGIVWLVGD